MINTGVLQQVVAAKWAADVINNQSLPHELKIGKSSERDRASEATAWGNLAQLHPSKLCVRLALMPGAAFCQSLERESAAKYVWPGEDGLLNALSAEAADAIIIIRQRIKDVDLFPWLHRFHGWRN